MKFLYVDICARTVNATNSLIPALLQFTSDTVCYGPGFVSEAQLERGIDKFIDEHGGFDYYVTTLFKPDLGELDFQYLHRFTHPNYPVASLRRFASDFASFVKRKSMPVILFLTGLDPYGISEETAQLVAQADGYLVGWGGGFSVGVDELDRDVIANEEFFARKKKMGRTIGLWHDLVKACEGKFINFGHWMAESEFDWRALDGRRDQAVVPGQMYVRRKTAKRQLAQRGFLARSGQFKQLSSLADHMGLRPLARPLWQSLFNQTFIKSIATTRYAYTDGCGYEIPVRKFFEIPALGSILLCTPCGGFEGLGFRDRVNTFIVAPDAIGDAIGWLRKDPDRAQNIADAGRQLVWDSHSLHARAEQFKACLTSIAAGRFRRSRWDKGTFVVDEAA